MKYGYKNWKYIYRDKKYLTSASTFILKYRQIAIIPDCLIQYQIDGSSTHMGVTNMPTTMSGYLKETWQKVTTQPPDCNPEAL